MGSHIFILDICFLYTLDFLISYAKDPRTNLIIVHKILSFYQICNGKEI